jgi:O-6-methylguanine DNA methyltransferase
VTERAFAWGCLDTPVGRLSVACTAAGVAKLRYGDVPETADTARAGTATAGTATAGTARAGTATAGTATAGTATAGTATAGTATAGTARPAAVPGSQASALLDAALAELAEYFGGRLKSFSVPVDLSATSGARRTVLSVLHESVGFGETITYGGLAHRAGLTEGALTGGGQVPPARVVGQVMASNPCAVIVPCHRVVAGSGLGGYSGGTGTDVKQWLLIFEGAIPATLDWDPSGVSPARPRDARPTPAGPR